MTDIERNRHGISLSEWDERARELGASEEFFAWDKREEYWLKGMSPRWTIEHFRNVLIVRRETEKCGDFRKGNHLVIGRRARYHKK